MREFWAPLQRSRRRVVPSAPLLLPRLQSATLAKLASVALPDTSSGGWNEQQQLSHFQPPPPLRPTDRTSPSGTAPAASPRSPLPATITAQQELGARIRAVGMSAHGGGEGSLSSSSHDSLGELAAAVAGPSEAELSEIEQRKVVVLG